MSDTITITAGPTIEWVEDKDPFVMRCSRCGVPMQIDTHRFEDGKAIRFAYHVFMEGGTCPNAGKNVYETLFSPVSVEDNAAVS